MWYRLLPQYYPSSSSSPPRNNGEAAPSSPARNHIVARNVAPGARTSGPRRPVDRFTTVRRRRRPWRRSTGTSSQDAANSQSKTPSSSLKPSKSDRIIRLLSIGYKKNENEDEDENDDEEDQLFCWLDSAKEQDAAMDPERNNSNSNSQVIPQEAMEEPTDDASACIDDDESIDFDLHSRYYDDEDEMPSLADPTVTTSVTEDHGEDETTITDDLEREINVLLQDHHAQQQAAQPQGLTQRRDSSLVVARRDSCSTISTAPDTPETPLVISEFLVATSTANEDGQMVTQTTTTTKNPAFVLKDRGQHCTCPMMMAQDSSEVSQTNLCPHCTATTIWPLEFLFVQDEDSAKQHPPSNSLPGIRKSKKFVPDPMNVGDFYGDDDEEIRFIPAQSSTFWKEEEEKILFMPKEILQGAQQNYDEVVSTIDDCYDGTTTITSWREDDDDDDDEEAGWDGGSSIRSDESSVSEILGRSSASINNPGIDNGGRERVQQKELEDAKEVGRNDRVLHQAWKDWGGERNRNFIEAVMEPLFSRHVVPLQETKTTEVHDRPRVGPRLPRRCPSVGLDTVQPPMRNNLSTVRQPRHGGPSGSKPLMGKFRVQRLEI